MKTMTSATAEMHMNVQFRTHTKLCRDIHELLIQFRKSEDFFLRKIFLIILDSLRFFFGLQHCTNPNLQPHHTWCTYIILRMKIIQLNFEVSAQPQGACMWVATKNCTIKIQKWPHYMLDP